jgi:large subunit ribosomal protein L23
MNQERVYQVIRAPHVSEKGTVLAESARQHIFKVACDATKAEVKEAIETIFKVKVGKVRIMNIKGKVKRFGGRLGKRSDLRKAYVTLLPGNDIDFAGLN